MSLFSFTHIFIILLMASPSNSNSTTTPHLKLRQPYAFRATAANNLHHHQPPPHAMVVQAECLKNHAAHVGGHALDGCGAFMPSFSGNPLTCAACGCHQNFHRRREVAAQHQHYVAYVNPAPPELCITFQSAGRSSSSSLPSQQHQMLPSNFYAPSLTPVGGNSTKRFRTRFTKLQKEKMLSFADKMGWKIGKCNQAAVEHFCQEIGVARNVLKVWMHNHKKESARKLSGGGDAAENVSTAGTNGSENGVSSPSS